MYSSNKIFLILVCLLLPVLAFGQDASIQSGNVIRITVLGAPELSGEFVVRPDGTTDYPLLANVPIDGMTQIELKEFLIPLLSRLVERPKVFISLADYLQITVTVQGQVRTPGPYELKAPINLQGVISVAGGTLPLANLHEIRIMRRVGDEVITFNLHDYYQDKSSMELPLIEDEDVIFVPILTSETTVRVLGSVREPGSYVPSQDQNVADMIYMAGGPMPNGNMREVQYITVKDNKKVVIELDIEDLFNNGLTDDIPSVKLGDVIIIKDVSQWRQFSWWAQILRDAALVASSIVIMSRL